MRESSKRKRGLFCFDDYDLLVCISERFDVFYWREEEVPTAGHREVLAFAAFR